ncbi:hypothetical protein ACFVY0_33010 [Streptomyces sp. NPDC058286]|uniref:hypothetical protein n=1 Tax=Streptomyces sp. NPDC058286 TaxID=3346422 RepID=UPI0036E6599E
MADESSSSFSLLLAPAAVVTRTAFPVGGHLTGSQLVAGGVTALMVSGHRSTRWFASG